MGGLAMYLLFIYLIYLQENEENAIPSKKKREEVDK